MQPAFAQETQHGSPESHSGTTTTVPSGQSTEHGASDHQPSATSGHDAADTTLKTESHDASEGHAPAGSEATKDHNAPLKTDAHSVESHSDTAASGEHGAAATHGEEHGAAAGHGGAHEAGHSTGYHPPAPYVIDVAGQTIHLNTVLATWMVMAILIVMAISATRKLAKKPTKGQIFFESLVDLPHYVIKSQISHNTTRYVPLIGTIFLFILTANWLGLLPWRIIELDLFGLPAGFEIAAPTNDLNTNAPIAITAVASYWFFGIKKKGLAHFKHYFQPMWFLFPLNMMEDVSRPLSLSFRLFGNILGGEIVIGILLFLTSAYVVTSIVVLPMFLLEVLVGFIQAFIFSMLTASYIGGMVAEHH